MRTQDALKVIDRKLDLVLADLGLVEGCDKEECCFTDPCTDSSVDVPVDPPVESLTIVEKTANRNPVRRDFDEEVLWISVNELIEVWLRSPFGKMVPPPGNWGTQSLMSSDTEYAAVTLCQAEQILKETTIDDITWQENKTDCDNISMYMAARVAVLYGLNCVAIVDAIDEGHSYCAFLLRDENDDVYLRGFEPQTDQWRDDVEPKLGWIHFR